MKIKLITISKTNKKFLIEGESEYQKRLKRYVKLDRIEIPDIKNAKSLSKAEIKLKEGEIILSKIDAADLVVLLDDKGVEFTSMKFAKWIQNKRNLSVKNAVFVVGGAYGFSDAVYARANEKMSLSKLTFSHQMVRMIFLEQLYRAFTILNNEPYHHE
ncbi:23S rRNA (pseudouridine(1915)-N(3))-methyltransferase RlmH [Putridiphycobacter roseus]|uniref:Ribosomal RNA large subunit methyltransferase H n=1 Tax=Putridiphycobacter roseus TaxID=2219161 RepID=A0A2W1N2W4_9FLAO|nr:23S rRNA (pseudouridine(1915)-N(3))-methyltransferase RlmH [Putridiphycobacter roseus]PZE18657.1 23S rRNA (pseudouridine(1915)-N(3))-methyltransferase RlmH [Putridiphycobacter roseus]